MDLLGIKKERKRAVYTDPAVVYDPYGQPGVIVPYIAPSKAMTRYTHDGGGFWKYLPVWEPLSIAEYAAWPKALRDIVLREWSGDFTYRKNWKVPGAPLEAYNPLAGYGLVGEGFTFVEWKLLSVDMYVMERAGWTRYNGLTPDKVVYDDRKTVLEDLNDIGKGFVTAAEQAGKMIGSILSTVAPAFAFIPGIGTGIAAALSAAGRLAMGEDLETALLEAAIDAIPGGRIAKLAITAGVTITTGIINGDSIEDIGLDSARAVAVAQGGPAAAAAFDATVAIIQGKALQEMGFAVLKGFAKGNDLAERAVRYSEMAATAIQTGQPIEQVLIKELGKEMGDAAEGIAREQLEPILERIVNDPVLRDMQTTALALYEGVPEPIARAAQVIVEKGFIDEPLKEKLLTTAHQAAIRKYGEAAVLAKQKSISQARAEKRTAQITSALAVKDNQSLIRTRPILQALEPIPSIAAAKYEAERAELESSNPSISAQLEAYSKKGYELATKDGVIAAAREKQTTGPKRRGFDIGSGLPPFANETYVRNFLATLEKPGFDVAIAVRNGRGKTLPIKVKDPITAAGFYATQGSIAQSKDDRVGVISTFVGDNESRAGVEMALHANMSLWAKVKYLFGI